MPNQPEGLTRGEVVGRRNERPTDCQQCQSRTPVDHWPSALCRSSFRQGDDGEERTFRTHCTCDLCF